MISTASTVTIVVFDRNVTIESDSHLIKWESDITGSTTPVPNVPPIREGDWVVSPEDEAIVREKELFFSQVRWTERTFWVSDPSPYYKNVGNGSLSYVWEGVHAEGVCLPQWCKREWTPKKELFALAQKDGRIEQAMQARLRNWLADLPESCPVCPTGLPDSYELAPWVKQILEDWNVPVPQGTIFGRNPDQDNDLVAVMPSGQTIFGRFAEDIADKLEQEQG